MAIITRFRITRPSFIEDLRDNANDIDNAGIIAGVLESAPQSAKQKALANELGSEENNLPSRPFIRTGHDQIRDEYLTSIGDALTQFLDDRQDLQSALEEPGNMLKQSIENTIDQANFLFEPLKQENNSS